MKTTTQKKEALEGLFREHYAYLALVAFGVVGDKDIAKDIVQDFFVWYCQKEKEIAVRATFKTYATRAVKNLSIQHIEKKKRKVDILKNLNPREFEEPFALANKISNEQRLRELLDKLPTARREIFISYVAYNMSYSEIAKENDISINTVKTQMKRAYAFFKNHIPDNSILVILVTLLLKNV
ncbi:sigma-70 family RNA polymerase sigma factor [Flagellimonas sp.]|uniref:sigma-70 family RNA polymerase sigma factor n=1 Tax=Flagellimonas sp. TaxID=2058762 RepID=UPI003B520381